LFVQARTSPIKADRALARPWRDIGKSLRTVASGTS
jgi:hypothetical protein